MPNPMTFPFLQKWTRAVHSEVDKGLAFGVEVDGIELISEKSMGPVMPNPMTFPLLSRSGWRRSGSNGHLRPGALLILLALMLFASLSCARASPVRSNCNPMRPKWRLQREHPRPQHSRRRVAGSKPAPEGFAGSHYYHHRAALFLAFSQKNCMRSHNDSDCRIYSTFCQSRQWGGPIRKLKLYAPRART